MTESLYQQVISLLTIPPGNLVYHLVLTFSIAGAMPGALNLWQRGGLAGGYRMVIGLCLLLLAQFILIFDAALAQFFPAFELWLPILDRGTTAFSLVILIWLWVFPEPSRRADYATLLLSLLIILLAVLTGIWWLDQTSQPFFNGSLPDMLWTGLSLVLAFVGGLLIVFRRPNGYGIGLAMFALLFLGQLAYFLDPLPVGNFPGVVRLTQIAAYPLLLTLPSRFSLGTLSADRSTHGISPLTFQQFTALATRTDPLEVCQSTTAIVSHALSADLCLLISPPDAKGYISLYCGYDLANQENIGAATFDSNLVPILSESLRQGRPLHLPAEGNIPDLAGFGKILNLSLSVSLLSAPIFSSGGDLDKALVLISLDPRRSWSAGDQNFLADIAQSLSAVYEYKNDYLAYEEKLAQANNALQNLQVENERLATELKDITANGKASAQQVGKLQSDLRLALDEIASLGGAKSKEGDMEGLPE